MARLAYVDKKTLPAQYRTMAFSDSNITRALLHSPNSANQSGVMARHIREGMRLDPRLREMALIQVGYSTRCAYEYVHHAELGLSCGVSEDDIRAIAQESAGRPTQLDPLAQAVIRAAREMTFDLSVSDETFSALRKGLDDECLVDLVLAIANYNAVVRLLLTLQVDVEDAYLHYLEKFPLAG